MYGDPQFENIEDNLEPIHHKFLGRRSVGLHKRFPGWYRAVVEETNDPLQFRRVRVRIPELHNNDVEVKDLPWAIPAPWMGGQNAGSFTHAIIGDIVFICYENNHSYAPIYCAAGDPTRRRMYSMWSMYTKSPQSVNEEGDPADTPKEFLEDYLPKDGRPMNTGQADRYGSFLNFSSYGFAPKKHKIDPASVGTDALAKKDYEVNKDQPKDNEPDLKYISMGTKYGHMAIFGDQGYKWFEEFKGDFESDKSFEEKRYQYLLKYFNEEEPKEHDQRRIDIRTRLGHKFEMRDVGWDKSRAGEYDSPKTIGDSKGRDERWIKLRTKGGHIIQALDKGFDPESDNYYKELNKSQKGVKPDKEDQLGDDSRMIRFVTRHGNELILDDRGTSSTAGENKTPQGNGVLLRSRRGHQLQMVDKDEQNHFMLTSGGDQVIEMNDKHDYMIGTTKQSDDVHTEMSAAQTRTRPRYISKTGQTNDPEANTYHWKLDKKNGYVRFKTKDGAGLEARDKDAPCGQWTETRDFENRAVWMSTTDNWMLIRSKKGVKYILLDDNDDVILIRNEKGKIQIRAKEKIEIKCDEGDICIEAPKGQVGIKAKSVEISTGAASHKIDPKGIGTSETIEGRELKGRHPQMGCAFAAGGTFNGAGAGIPSPKTGNPCKIDPKIITRKKPLDFDKERGCDPIKSQKGPIPESVTSGGSDGGPGGPGSGGGGAPTSQPPPQSPFAPTEPSATPPPTPEPVPDPIEELNPGGGGVLWCGLSSKFLDEVEENGLLLASFVNNLNEPPDKDSTEIHLAKSLAVAEGKTQAILSQQRYGDTALILRIRNVPDPDLLVSVEGNDDVLALQDDLPFEGNIEIFSVGTVELTQPPLFPDVS